MAVKPISNPRLPMSVTANRAEQVTMKNFVNRSSNDSETFVPGYDSRNYAITLKDIDTSVLKHIIDSLLLMLRKIMPVHLAPDNITYLMIVMSFKYF